MKCILTIISVIIIFGISQGQSFEGKLIYKVDFQINEVKLAEMGVTKDMMVNKMKKEGEFFDEITYYIKGGNYIKEANSTKNKRFIYKTTENKIYLFEANSDYVLRMNAENTSSISKKIDDSIIQINEIDSIKVIQNDTCKLIKLTWGNLSDEYHWYNHSKINIDNELFQKHNYEYLNKILQLTKAFPMEVTKSVGEFMTITMTIEKIEETKLDEEIFVIPELKKSKRKGDKYVEKMTGNKMMRIKN